MNFHKLELFSGSPGTPFFEIMVESPFPNAGPCLILKRSRSRGISYEHDNTSSTKWPLEGVVAPWCNPLILQPEQSGGVGSSPGRAPPLEHHDKGSRTRLGLLYFCDSSAWR